MNIGLGIGIPFNRSQIWLSLFSPSSLFANNEQGVWLDPSDLTTLYQDAAGNTPVTAVEQPVGLMLDKSKGLGPELVTNGDFDTDITGWTASTSASISWNSGTLRVTKNTTANYPMAVQDITLTPGRAYRITCSVSNPFNRNLQVSFGGIANNVGAGTSRSVSTILVATASTLRVEVGFFLSSGSVSEYIDFDNISVRELPGNHAFNPSGNSANFPVLSARYNLLTKTEDISAADWTKAGTVTASTSSLFETATTGTHSCYLLPTTVAATYIYSVKLKANGRTRVAIAGTSSFGGNLGSGVFFDLSTGSYVSGATGTPSITALADGWYQVSYTWTAFAASGALGIFLVDSGTNISYAGDVTKGVLIKEADLRVANDALNQPAYQRVNTSTDYDTVGFKTYLRFNGVSQWLQTNSIDFTYSDKMFVCAGVRKLNDAASGIAVELSASVSLNNGSFLLYAPFAAGDYRFSSKGTLQATRTLSPYSAPITNVFSGIADVAGKSLLCRINGAPAGITGAIDQGTGNYGNYPLYIGARAGSSLWFNGRLYGMVVAGKQASAAEIQDTEKYMNLKTAAYN